MIVVSGGFAPIHIGHIRLFQAAAKLDDLTVVLNSDAWLQLKTGNVFMPWEERAEILRELRSVTDVVSVNDKDGTVCEALGRLRPQYFANGGDRTVENTPELALCEKLGIQPLFNVGGEKVRSSTELLRNYEG